MTWEKEFLYRKDVTSSIHFKEKNSSGTFERFFKIQVFITGELGIHVKYLLYLDMEGNVERVCGLAKTR